MSSSNNSAARKDEGSQPPSGIPSRSIILLTVGIDGSMLPQILETVTADTFLRLESVSSLDAARRFIESSGPTPIVVLIEHAHLDRVLSFPSWVHVIALTGPGQEVHLDMGIDEYFARPVRTMELRARLRVAARALARSGSSTTTVMLEALATGKSGEVIVAHGEESARIHIERGMIAWVHRSQHPASIRQLIGRAGGTIDDQTVRDVMDQSRQTRQHFAETVVEWNIVERDAMRDCLRRHLLEELVTIQSWDAANATFVSDQRESSTSLAFSASELGITSRSGPRIATVTGMQVTTRPSVEPSRIEAWLDRVLLIEHVIGCAVVDLSTGSVLGSLGLLATQMNTVWELARAFHALGEDRDELLASAKQNAFLVRATPNAPNTAFAVYFDTNHLSPAMARILVSKMGPL